MIGVIANPDNESVIREFFELFKVPWEFFRADCRYEVVLCNGQAQLDQVMAKLIVVYADDKTHFDIQRKIQIQSRRSEAVLSLQRSSFPIFGNNVTFRRETSGGLLEKSSGEPASFVERSAEGIFARIGYDLFREVQILLTKGQPPENASVPTLELHIAFLRDLITGCGIPLLEIPPVPDGYSFIGCLTHDVDFASIRGHKFDPTMFGFLYRATLGSAIDLCRSRTSARKLLINWAAAAKLPFVFLGFARDYWYEFDRYVEMEKGRPSTFFVIPFSGYPGRNSEGMAPGARACRYDISQIAPKIPKLTAAGCEIGLHGIDAWFESASGRREAGRIAELARTTDLGVRMHWLYSDERSAGVLEEAEFAYDSTVGYNEAVGFRAGTTQVFKPLQATRLLELPMHVMDTAMFYPTHMNLSMKEAWSVVDKVMDNTIRHGGVLTINWHDRSIAPERLWGDFYSLLLDNMTAKRAWFSTAGQAVSWFRRRRAAVFEKAEYRNGVLSARVVVQSSESLPGLRLRFHNERSYTDTSLNNSIEVQFSN